MYPCNRPFCTAASTHACRVLIGCLIISDKVNGRDLKALLHGAIFHATCLAMMICAALQLQGEGCYTLQRVCEFFR